MNQRSYPTKESVMERAQELADAKLTFGSLDEYDRLSKNNKGDLGQIIEESWFGYKPNSDKDPDFKEAGIELKVSPYKETKNGFSAKERLVCDIINYMEEVHKTFETSAFWHKCKSICLLSYLWREDIPKEEFYVDHATLLEYPREDLLIIKHDWEIIIDKIRNGQAHLLSEGDTLYLGACTKGGKTTKPRQQPYSSVLAKQRAYSLKTTYMTHFLRTKVLKEAESEHIVKDWKALEQQSFEDLIDERLSQYYGRGLTELEKEFEVNSKAYQHVEILLGKMLGISGNIRLSDEFTKANIIPKTVRVLVSGLPKEAMSFPTFKFLDLIKTDWENSEIYQTLSTTRFMFVVFQQEYTYDKDKAVTFVSTAKPLSSEPHDNRKLGVTDYLFKGVLFWRMPQEDLEQVHSVWKATVKTINDGVKLVPNRGEILNNLPKSTDNPVAHVRPHVKNAAYILGDGTVIGKPTSYANPLPDGRWMTTQCFWLNKSYVKSVIDTNMSRKQYSTGAEYSVAAEEMPTYNNVMNPYKGTE